MKKIVKGIKHIVALKNLDKNKTTYSQAWKRQKEDGTWEYSDTNPQDGSWTPYVKVNEGSARTYHCVIQNVDTDKAIQASWDATHAKTLMDGDVYYVAFIFPASGENATELLDVGRVSLAVIDDNNEIIYYNKRYAKVSETKLSVTTEETEEE